MPERRTPPTPHKRAWPLVTLAATSFVPFLGIFLGSAAVTWGLVTDRPRARLAIALGASGALLQLGVGMVIGLVMRDSETMRATRSAMVATNLTELVIALDAYRADAGEYPATLQAFVGHPVPTRLINIQDHHATLFSMRPYEYHVAPDGLSFDLFSIGPDREPGTEDDVRPVLPDSLLSRTGYRAARPPSRPSPPS